MLNENMIAELVCTANGLAITLKRDSAKLEHILNRLLCESDSHTLAELTDEITTATPDTLESVIAAVLGAVSAVQGVEYVSG